MAIPLIVTDSHHRPTPVTVESLAITDQKTLVTGASLVRGVDFPVELGVLIDASSSQRSADLVEILNTAKRFVDESIRGPEDRVFFLKFDAAPHATGWFKREQLQSATIPVGIGGGTALYDALAMACKERMGLRDWQKPARRILVLISDGEDNLSHTTRDEAALDALRAGAVIFTIDTELSGMSYRGVKIMQNLAEVTGGRSFSQVGREDAPKVFASIKEMIDGMYYLRYVPPNASSSAVHEVKVNRTPKEKFKVSYARKYLWKQ
ncbi:MAG TPA: VWA domain-containing protein [Terriglobales bacterium]|nr:VWA domain-containing protein [Terriglobales bacterium]